MLLKNKLHSHTFSFFEYNLKNRTFPKFAIVNYTKYYIRIVYSMSMIITMLNITFLALEIL
jgi:hypothetical protein